MTMRMMTSAGLAVGMLLCGGAQAAENEQDGPRARLYLPISGTFEGGGTFAGTLSIQKFSQVNGQVVAIGVLTGSATSGGAPLGTTLAGPIAFPVRVEPGSAIGGSAPVTLQPAQTCQALHLELGAVNLNVLGLQVTTQPIVLDVSAVSGGTNVLGQLVCTILQTLGNVVGLVNLLNQLLGLLGGLTG